MEKEIKYLLKQLVNNEQLKDGELRNMKGIFSSERLTEE